MARASLGSTRVAALTILSSAVRQQAAVVIAKIVSDDPLIPQAVRGRFWLVQPQFFRESSAGSMKRLTTIVAAIARSSPISPHSHFETVPPNHHQYSCESDQDALEVGAQWVRNKISDFSYYSMFP